jgi:ankyrin repeat protein
MNSSEIRKLIELNTTEANTQLKEYLSDKNVYNISFPHGENMLHFAAGSNNADLCRYLIEEKGLIVDMCNSRSAVALTYASLQNATDAIEVLLEHNADVRIRSGFSGMFPHQDAKTDKTMNMILKKDRIIPIDYDNNYMLKYGYNLYQSYMYRRHRYYLQYVSTEFLKKNNIPMMRGMDAKDEYGITSQGFDNLLNQYKQVRGEWLESLTSDFETPTCLNCGNTNNVHRCSKCKAVYFCNKSCQKSAHLLHNLDCK